jgi:hypothetical protein
VAFFLEGLLDGLRHLKLSTAKLVGRMGAREHASGREELVERALLFLDARDTGRGGLRGGSHGVSIIAVPVPVA